MDITREQAQALIDKHITTDWIKLHSRETEVIMRALAKHFGENEKLWALTGLLHDLDMDQIDQSDPKDHGLKTEEILKAKFGEKLPEEILQAIKAHCENLRPDDVKRKSKLDFALGAAENLSGFLVACALVQPDKRLSSVKPESVMKKLKTPAFARNVNRQFIYDIEKTGMELEKFVKLALDALLPVADELGL